MCCKIGGEVIKMEKTTCESCAHFHPHYGISGGQIFRIHCGHCAYPKIRHKRPTTNACQHYTPGSPDEHDAVTKEYLCKTLLHYCLSLQLLPPIEDAPIRPSGKIPR